MEIYSTEEQQEEAIKKAIQENWKVVVFGTIIGLGSVFGWRQYSAHQLEVRGEQSDAYDEIVQKIGQDGTDIAALANEYVNSHDNKSYSVLLALHAAKDAVGKSNFDEAAKQLQFAADNAEDASVKAVSRVRLARVQIEQQKYDDALKSLGNQFPESFTAQVEELKGDVYVAQNNIDKARTAYQAAADNDGLTNNNGLQYKLDNLAIATP